MCISAADILNNCTKSTQIASLSGLDETQLDIFLRIVSSVKIDPGFTLQHKLVLLGFYTVGVILNLGLNLGIVAYEQGVNDNWRTLINKANRLVDYLVQLKTAVQEFH